ncbi:hypothetical protein ACSFC1_03995 [Pseudothermotoga sp. U03pept]|uniref:hypothetical protein n=1 Tax=Pseudothermotoga sp. U03pept TaxID=3447012 RepID=UPI003EFCFDAD
MSELTITVLPKTVTIGRVNYVKAIVLSENGSPLRDVDVTFEYLDGTWKSLSTIKTDSNGIASQEFPYRTPTRKYISFRGL